MTCARGWGSDGREQQSCGGGLGREVLQGSYPTGSSWSVLGDIRVLVMFALLCKMHFNRFQSALFFQTNSK